jgi:signal transduction histidine kinase
VSGLLTVLAFALMVWSAYLAGTSSRAATVAVAAVATASAAVKLVVAPSPQHVAVLVVFVVLPLLVGRYLAQHRTLVSTLDAHNRQLRTERALLAEREQLRERLRIARDMHDSLGRRLSLVSVRAAALEVSDLPARQRDAVRALAGSARDAVTELYELIGSLRAAHDAPGADAIAGLVAEFRKAGVEVQVTCTGTRQPLPPAADHAAYRVVEEGLTNAAKHARGRPVAIQLTWETDTLVVTMTNPLGTAVAGGGFGLAGLAERVGAAAGFLDHCATGAEFRLVAMLPTATVPPSSVRSARTALLGVATAAVLLIMLPVSLLTGVS